MLAGFRFNTRFQVSAAILAVIVLFAAFGPLFPGRHDPFANVGGLYNHPSARLWLGTDNFGHDVLTQLMYGTRTSLVIGLVAGAVATLIGVALGTLAGFRGGLLEEALMGVTNVILAIPAFVILIVLSVALSNRNLITMALVIGVTSWPWTARAVRAQAASLRVREHVDIARLSGAGTARLIMLEILPYMASYVSMAFVLQLAGAILAEAGLSLLGLGPSNIVSLGIMLHWALLWESVRTGAWWAFVPPTLLLTVIAFSLLMIQSSMDEVFNPRLRTRGAARGRRGLVPVAGQAPIAAGAPAGATIGASEGEAGIGR
jgi:peptide/nickel transport system permease protein